MGNVPLDPVLQCYGRERDHYEGRSKPGMRKPVVERKTITFTKLAFVAFCTCVDLSVVHILCHTQVYDVCVQVHLSAHVYIFPCD